jgi:hypothetical protein
MRKSQHSLIPPSIGTCPMATRFKHVVDRRVAGIAETYVTGCVGNQDIIFWIYPDGAALQVGRRHQAFGFPKRESLVDTAREFLDEFMKVVDGPDAAGRN